MPSFYEIPENYYYRLVLLQPDSDDKRNFEVRHSLCWLLFKLNVRPIRKVV